MSDVVVRKQNHCNTLKNTKHNKNDSSKKLLVWIIIIELDLRIQKTRVNFEDEILFLMTGSSKAAWSYSRNSLQPKRLVQLRSQQSHRLPVCFRDQQQDPTGLAQIFKWLYFLCNVTHNIYIKNIAMENKDSAYRYSAGCSGAAAVTPSLVDC